MFAGLRSLFQSAASGITKNLKALGTNLQSAGQGLIQTVEEFAPIALGMAAIGAASSMLKKQQPAPALG